MIDINPADYDPLRRACAGNHWVFPTDDADKFMANVQHAQKGRLHLYGYNKTVLVDRNHPLLVRCRGLIVGEDGQVMSYPFDRFFNTFEPECATLDWKTATVWEKIDGSLIQVFWNGTDWEITTRGSFYPGPQSTFDEWFKEVAPKDLFSKLDKNHCYIYELVSRNNRIVTLYSDEAVYLTMARELRDLKEEPQEWLDNAARVQGVRRPRRFPASDVDAVKSLFAEYQLPDDFEGFVIVDGDFHRLKVKQDTYIKLAKIADLGPTDLFDAAIGRTECDPEFVQRLPDVRASLDELKAQIERMRREVLAKFEEIKVKPTRKEFALEAIKYSYKGILFSLLDGKRFDDVVQYSMLVAWGGGIKPK